MYGNTGQRREYKINIDSFQTHFPSMNLDQLVEAVGLAADTWNEHTNSAHFVNGGTTIHDRFSMPSDKADCDALGIDYSVIVAERRVGYAGQTFGRCSENGVATQFIIALGTMDPWYAHWNYTFLEPGPTEHDFVSVLVHELGHTLNLGHPANQEAAVMGPFTAGTSRQRDLYEWDLECVEALADHRDLTAWVRYHSGGVLGSESAFTGSWPVAKVSSGVSRMTGTWNWSAGLKRDVCTAWTNHHDQLNTTCVSLIYPQSSLGLTEATWREYDSIDRLLAPTHWEYPVAYDWGAVHRVRQVRSSDGFATFTFGTLYHCASMSSWMQCSGYTPVATGHAVAVGWDDDNERTVTVWAHQNRQSDADSRELRVAVGAVNEGILAQPDSLGERTKTPPAVACSDGAAGGWDCIVAFVRATDPYNEVAVRRFSAYPGSYRYQLVAEPSSHPISYNVRTGSRVALWYHDGRFWIAVRPSRQLYGSQALEVYSSTDGSYWTQVTHSIGYSAVGPSAVSYWTGTNALMSLH